MPREPRCCCWIGSNKGENQSFCIFPQAAKKKHQDLACLLFAQAFPFPQASLQHRPVNKLKTRDMETYAANGNGSSGHRKLCGKTLESILPSPLPSNAEEGKMKVKKKKSIKK